MDTTNPVTNHPSQVNGSSREIGYIIAGVVLLPALVVISMICCLFIRPCFKRDSRFWSRRRKSSLENGEEMVDDDATICDKTSIDSRSVEIELSNIQNLNNN